ncbi:Uncharacterized protein SAMN05518672_102206 [Chitinophaga sp. CF118]|uniref:hypothetical protein n=1 Tax=Chitinophaga sp. CF118 TaxID=1884367 RepID=UPI0008EF3DA7|nr:hypothetical protein [Chitinophaga sp. CF118]SFD50280.1 Uncharacterized protein SAMN05518672_102206 [Chitinophaga sp. CF118]
MVSIKNYLGFTLPLLLLLTAATAQDSYVIHMLETPPIKSIRGMSAVNDSVLWVSGTEGKVGFTTNRGKQWNWMSVPGYDTCDWRTIIAFSSQRALLLNAGEPARIVLTTNGGKTWNQVYYNDTKGIFFDGMTFRNEQEGMAIGDPLNGRFTIIYTHDGGLSWQPAATEIQPVAKDGEAIFAASNSSITKLSDGNACFVSGGTVSRFFSGWHHWKAVNWPMIQGRSGTGAFSVAFYNRQNGIAIGGDYMNDTIKRNNCLITDDAGLHWKSPLLPPGGYRSCVKYVSAKILIATGTSGTDLSKDGGLHWYKLSDTGFHAIAVSPGGKSVWLAGKERIAELVGNP